MSQLHPALRLFPLALTVTATLALAGGAAAPTGTAATAGGASPAGGAAGGFPGGGAGGAIPDSGPSLASTNPPTYKDVAYASVSSSQKIDIYLPSGSGPFPTVFYFHPGGFRLGSKDMVDGVPGQALLKAGYAIVSVGYRLSGEATFPAAVQDAKAAVRFARANAAKYRLDPNRFAAWGESAGGNLAALVGTTGNAQTLFDAPNLGNAGVSSAVKAVVDWYGPNDFLSIDTFLREEGCAASQINHNSAQSFESIYLGAAIPTVPARARQANPITYVDAKDPPFLLQNGDSDCNVGSQQGQLLLNALRKAGVKATLEMFPNTGHGGAAFETATNAQRVVTFLNTYLK